MYDFKDVAIETGEVGYWSEEEENFIKEPAIRVVLGDAYVDLEDETFDEHDEILLTLPEAKQLIALIQEAIKEIN